jgi:hypothetical protein
MSLTNLPPADQAPFRARLGNALILRSRDPENSVEPRLVLDQYTVGGSNVNHGLRPVVLVGNLEGCDGAEFRLVFREFGFDEIDAFG